MNAAWPLRLLAALAFAVALAGAPIAHADDSGESEHHETSDGGDDSDHDIARDLVESGAIHPLQEVVGAVATAAPGRIVGVRLGQSGGRWVYTFKVITSGGNRVRVNVDAASLAILKTETQ